MGKRIRFVSTCACILLPLLFLCLYARFNLLAFADGEAPYYIWNKEKTITTQEKRYDVLILGDSVANAGFLPAVLSDSCLNLALGGTSPMEMYFVLEDWLEHNAAPKVCYLSFNDGHLHNVDMFWKRSVYFHRFRPLQNGKMILSAIRHEDHFVLVDAYWKELAEYQIYLPNKYMTAIVNSQFGKRQEMNLATKMNDELQSGAYVATMGNNREYTADTDVIYQGFYVNPLYDEYYRRMIALCLENDIQVRIVKTPLPDNAVFTEEYEKDFYSYYSALQKDYPGITVDWLDRYEKDCFWDAFHMNCHGALRFSTEIKEMYPEDFGEDNYSKERVEAINFYIGQENRVDELLKWMSGKDYTAIVCDGTGEFEAYYQRIEKTEPSLCSLKNRSVKLKDGPGLTGQVFAVSGRDGLAEIPVSCEKDSLEIDVDGETLQFATGDDCLCVIVLDQYNQQQVCSKTFCWEDGHFVLS